MSPVVSILIPAYNAGRWIALTIQSALAQTWQRTEIIVVDDGSCDDTLAVAKRFASRDVLVLSQANQGASAARNRAFEHCQGNYIQWLDADDLLAPDKLAQQMEAVASMPDRRALFSSSWGWFMHRVSRAKFDPTGLWANLSPVDWLVRKIGENLHMQTGTWLVSRELTETAGPWDTRLSLDDDGEYFSRVLLGSSGVRFVPESKVFYRGSGSDSLSNVDRSRKKLESQFLSMQLHIRHVRSLEESERVRSACLRYLQNWYIFFYTEARDLAGQLEQLAAELGGRLQTPSLRRKYRWLVPLLGYAAARRAQSYLPRLRWDFARSWDKALAHFDNTPLDPGWSGELIDQRKKH